MYTILRLGVVELLVSLLSEGNKEGRARAAAALSKFAVEPDMRSALMQAEVVQPLVEVLTTGSMTGERRRRARTVVQGWCRVAKLTVIAMNNE